MTKIEHLFHPAPDYQEVIQRYLCSSCWGHLIATFDNEKPDLVKVYCAGCKDQTPGYVTKAYVESRRQQDGWDYLEAFEVLRKAKVIDDPDEGKSPDELLKEMGF